MRTLFLLPVLVLLMLPASFAIERYHFSGRGDAILGPFNISEGNVTLHIKHTTGCTICYFGIQIQADNDLDGIFYGEEGGNDQFLIAYSGGYEGIMNLDKFIDVDALGSVLGGKWRLTVSSPDDGRWEITVIEHPFPAHEISGRVTGVDAHWGLPKPKITAISEDGEEFSTSGDEWGAYSLKVWGFKAYKLTAEVPGYEPKTVKISKEEMTGASYGHLRGVDITLNRSGKCEPLELPIRTTFDSGAEGWRVTEDVESVSARDGYLEASDTASGSTIYWSAPEKYLGDWTGAYGDFLSFSLKQSTLEEPFDAEDVILETKKGTLTYSLEKPPGLSFTTYNVPLKPKGWKKDGVKISEEEFKDALTCVKKLLIRAEYSNKKDIDAIDNVMIGNGYEAKIGCSVSDKEKREPIKNAEVTAVSEDGNFKSRALTDERGACLIEGIPEGYYSVTASAKGYENKTKRVLAISGRTILQERFNLNPTGKVADAKFGSGLPYGYRVGQAGSYTVDIENGGPSPAKIKAKIFFPKDYMKAEWRTGTFEELHWDFAANTIISKDGKGKCVLENGVAECELKLKGEFPDALVSLPFNLSYLKSGKAIIKGTLETEMAVKDPDERNNQFSLERTIQPLVLSGSAFVIDKNNARRPLRDALVEITYNDDASHIKTFTDSSGRFKAEFGEVPRNVRAEIFLEDKSKTIQVLMPEVYSGTVSLKTKSFNLSPPVNMNLFNNMQFSPQEKRTDPSYSRTQRTWLPHQAIMYVETYRAMQFARNSLKIKLSHKLPVETETRFPATARCAACYTRSDSKIHYKSTDALLTHPDTPMNSQYHEFGHHVQAESKMGGKGGIPKSKGPYKNHGGLKNYDSADSLAEGFAEFYSLMVSGSPVYRWAGGATNLQRNRHSFRKNGTWVTSEEFNVAALLWDIVDNDKEYGDTIAQGISGAWNLINRNVNNIHELYKDMRSVINFDLNKNGRNDVDDLFILHGFYYDANKNNMFDSGDKPGYAGSRLVRGMLWNSYEAREDLEPVPGTALNVSLQLNGSYLNSSEVTFAVEIKYKDGESFSYTAKPFNSLIYLFLGKDTDYAIIRPEVPGYSSDEFVISINDYAKMVDDAQDTGRAYFAEKSFVLKRASLVMPVLSLENKTNESITLRIQSKLPAVLVRGDARIPRDSRDGTTIFHSDEGGVDSIVIDRGLYDDSTYYYALFSFQNGIYSEAAVLSARTESTFSGAAPEWRPAGNGKKQGNFPGLWWLAVILLIVLILAWKSYGKTGKTERKIKRRKITPEKP